jgi:putative ABC transport system permease protein
MISAITIVRQAARRLLRAPTFALAAILTLTLGIGGASAVFAVIDGVLLRPLPYPHAEQLVDLSHTLSISGIQSVDQSDATYLLYRRESRAFSAMGAYRATSMNVGGQRNDNGGDAGAPQRVEGALTTASLFGVLRTGPALGRGISEADAQPGAPAVALISHRLWRTAFGAEPAIIGRRVVVDGVDREIIGVMPDRFLFPSPATSVWLPLPLDPARTASAAFDYRAIGRLRDGWTAAAAERDLTPLLPRVPEVFPGRLTKASIVAIHMQPSVRPLRDVIIGDVGRLLWVVMGAVGALLLLACANVSNLFLARAEGRQHELAVRAALGAGRSALAADVLAEAALITAASVALGLALADAGIGLLSRLDAAASIPRLAEVSVGSPVVWLSIVVAILAALAVSALPVPR